MSRKPEYRLKFLNKVTDEKGILGAGWINKDKSISIVLNSFVKLEQNKDLELRLFLIDKKGNYGKKSKS